MVSAVFLHPAVDQLPQDGVRGAPGSVARNPKFHVVFHRELCGRRSEAALVPFGLSSPLQLYHLLY